MIIKKVYKKKYLIASLLILAGCSLEHNILINMKDNEYIVDYIQSRDLDLIPFLHPSDFNQWITVDSSEITLHYNRAFDYGDTFPSLFTINNIDEGNSVIDNSMYPSMKQKEIILIEPYQISTNNYFILKNYKFEGTFKGRRVKNNYDKLINYYSGFMDDAKLIIDENDISEENYESMDAIFNQLIGFLYIESINNSNIEFNQKAIYLNALKKWNEKTELFALINTNKVGIDGEKLKKILNAAEQYLYEVIDDSYIYEIKEIWRNLELEIYTTLFLLFNDFYIKVNMPNHSTYLHHNADSVYANTLLWNVDIDKFINGNFRIFAKSRIFYKTRFGLLLILLLIVSIFIVKNKYLKS